MTVVEMEYDAGPMSNTKNLGPGTLKVGEVGTVHDVSCLVNSITLSVEKSTTDSTTKLCGIVKPGVSTYEWTLSGNVDIDVGDASGFFAETVTAFGVEMPFEFDPSFGSGLVVTGMLTLEPLDLGGDETGSTMTSDFEFVVTGRPEYTWT